jgi:hypothetical protein
MGNWSQRVGTIFLDWLAALSGLKWIDVGCGNGAFTELIVERHAPAEVRALTRPRINSPLRAHDPLRVWQSSTVEMQWHFHSRQIRLT